jgi:hypothetical protein
VIKGISWRHVKIWYRPQNYSPHMGAFLLHIHQTNHGIQSARNSC